jgi:hypothetical protein
MSPIGQSTSGLLGAGAGIFLAWVAYVAVARTFRQRLSTSGAAMRADERSRIEHNWFIIRIMLLADFVILGTVGYYVGRLLGA